MSRMNQRYRKEQRRREAGERAVERAKLSDQQQLQKLDKMLGVGVGAKRERTRLTKEVV